MTDDISPLLVNVCFKCKANVIGLGWDDSCYYNYGRWNSNYGK